MSITDELRESMMPCISDGWLTITKGALNTIADRIDAEHERECKEQYAIGVEHGIGASIDASVIQTHGYIELPKDADGEYVHVGDVMVYADGNTCPLPVVALVPPAVFLTEDGPRYADMCRHAPDTWERIIRDAIGEGMARERSNHNGGYDRSGSLSNASLVARCKALVGDAS